jgi:hypothetical protein
VRRGVVFRIERRSPELFARRISGVAIFPCERGREQALAAAFDKGGAERVTDYTGATICRKTNVGCARRDAPDILHPAPPGSRRRPHCRISVSEGGVGLRSGAFMALMPVALCLAGSPSLGSGCGQAESTTR